MNSATARLGIGMTSLRTRERLVERLVQQGIEDQRVLDQFRSVPRHLFVDEALSHRAYEDTALPIGHAQTISQPYVVAKMTSALIADGPRDKVLEIGTGSGYQAAVLSGLVKQVFTIERIQPLFFKTRPLLSELGYHNVRCRFGDGFKGWKMHAPFDGIIVTAAPEHVPAQLASQLKEGGIMMIPVGPKGNQDLVKLTRVGDSLTREVVGKVSFVPLLQGIAN